MAVLALSSQAISILLSEMLVSAQLWIKEVCILGAVQNVSSPLGDPCLCDWERNTFMATHITPATFHVDG